MGGAADRFRPGRKRPTLRSLPLGEGLEVEGTSSAADQVSLSRGRLEGGSNGLSCASVASSGGLIRERPLTARSFGESVPDPLSISLRQGVFEPNQVGETPTLRAVASLVVVECRSYTTPRLTQLGWWCLARGDATWQLAACCCLLGFGGLVGVFGDRFSCKSLRAACGALSGGE
jgi:hypothetical protein